MRFRFGLKNENIFYFRALAICWFGSLSPPLILLPVARQTKTSQTLSISARFSSDLSFPFKKKLPSENLSCKLSPTGFCRGGPKPCLAALILTALRNWQQRKATQGTRDLSVGEQTTTSAHPLPDSRCSHSDVPLAPSETAPVPLALLPAGTEVKSPHQQTRFPPLEQLPSYSFGKYLLLKPFPWKLIPRKINSLEAALSP